MHLYCIFGPFAAQKSHYIKIAIPQALQAVVLIHGFPMNDEVQLWDKPREPFVPEA